MVGKNALVAALYKNAPTVILVENSDNFSLQYYIETKKVCVDAAAWRKSHLQLRFPIAVF